MLNRMAVFIHDIATAVPPTAYRQDFLREVMVRQFEDQPQTQNFLRRIYDRSGIEQRHSVVEDFREGQNRFLLFDPVRGPQRPGTAMRNEAYVESAARLALEAGKSLLGETGRFSPDEVTHLITVSCTGCSAPGFDYALVRRLGLPASTHRYHVGFMGCFAAFQALQMASAFCRADPAAVVLIVCVEICTIHLQLDEQPDHLVSGAVFADGAAGALVSARRPTAFPAYRIEGLASALADEGEQDMVWRLGDFGFEIGLSRYVPAILESHLERALQPLWTLIGEPSEGACWAVHPGGRAILDKVEAGLGLAPDRLAASRTVLARYGNMSSATILFVLRELLDSPAGARAEPVVAMAFGPGITIESGLLTRLTEKPAP